MERQKMCIIFGTLIYLQTILSAIGGIKCLWSSQTLQTVTSCPENTDEMKVRDRKKNCDSIAREQNCTKPEKFMYHCVMNALENAFIEVCAPEYRIHVKGCYEVVKNKIPKSSTKLSLLIQSTPGYANYTYLYITSCEPCMHLAPMLYLFTLSVSVRGIECD